MNIRDWLHRDDQIDALIDSNRATHRPGMERPDTEQMQRIGRARWVVVAKGQQRQYQEEEL